MKKINGFMNKKFLGIKKPIQIEWVSNFIFFG